MSLHWLHHLLLLFLHFLGHYILFIICSVIISIQHLLHHHYLFSCIRCVFLGFYAYRDLFLSLIWQTPLEIFSSSISLSLSLFFSLLVHFGKSWVGQSAGGASVVRIPVVLMTGLPSVFEQKGQLGPCQLPSWLQPLSVSVRPSAENRRMPGHPRGCCQANRFSPPNYQGEKTQCCKCQIPGPG